MDTNPEAAPNADLAWKTLNNVCDELKESTTQSRRRSSRKSWFENPPATKLDIACEKKKRRSSGTGKSRKSVENMETLLLTHFTNPPKIIFGKVKTLGKMITRHLLVKNPHDYEQEVVIEKFPTKKKFSIESRTFTVPAEDCLVLTIDWNPEEDGCYKPSGCTPPS